MALEQIELEDLTSAQQNLDSYLEKIKVNFTTIFELSVFKCWESDSDAILTYIPCVRLFVFVRVSNNE